MGNGKIEYIEHTADIGLRVYADDLVLLFVLSAKGMFSLIYENIDKLAMNETVAHERNINKKDIELVAYDLETLLVSWLNELIYYYSVDKLLFFKFNILTLKPLNQNSKYTLTAEVYGEHLSILNIKPHIEIKATTYHKLQITQDEHGKYYTEIYFDV